MPFTSHYLLCAGLEIHTTDWPASRDCPMRGTVLAWHGLARTGRDMDELAAHLSAQGYRVICPDTIGRGLSQWSAAPEREYCLAFYARIARELLDQLGIAQFHWVGTSMGGAIGMVCASGLTEPSLKTRIVSLTLNDNAPPVGPSRHRAHQSLCWQPPCVCHNV